MAMPPRLVGGPETAVNYGTSSHLPSPEPPDASLTGEVHVEKAACHSISG